MIVFFSGTGNSRYVAQRLGTLTGDEVHEILGQIPEALNADETLGLVFPVYAWGMPRVFAAALDGWLATERWKYVYMVCTCGDDIGCTHHLLSRDLRRRTGRGLAAAFSVRMPNTYIGLPGFDVDSEETVKDKLAVLEDKLVQIAAVVRARHEGWLDVYPGSWPRVKSYILRPLFWWLLSGDRHFRTTAQCTRCGKCVASCPMGNIAWSGEGERTKLQWMGACALCLRCYHACPVRAIEYVPFGRGKGQYVFSKNGLHEEKRYE